jgi:hypothetical protein
MKEEITKKFFKDFRKSFEKITDTCSGVVSTYRSDFLDSICNDFDTSHWISFQSLLMDVCEMPGTPDGGRTNPLKSSLLFQSARQDRAAAKSGNVPGGFESDERQSLFGFLSSGDDYLTFGSHSPISLNWETSVADFSEFTSGLELSQNNGRSTLFSILFSVQIRIHFRLVDRVTPCQSESLHRMVTNNTLEYRCIWPILILVHFVLFLKTIFVLKTFIFFNIGDYFAVRITEDPL